MTIIWHKLSEKKPDEKQMCWITSTNGMSPPIIGPLPYTGGMFIDILATPEAGAAYSEENGVTHWTEENNINGPEE